MALTLATELANYAAGIGTQGATLKVDSANKRVGVGTTNPQGPEGSLQVGTGITFFGNTGIISAIGGKFSGDFTVGGTLTYEDVQNVNSSGVGTFSGGINIVGGGLTVTGVSTFFSRVSIADSIVHTGDIDTSLRFPAANTFSVETGGTERLRVFSDASVRVGDNTIAVAAVGAGPTFAVNGAAPEITLRDSATDNPYAWMATNDNGSLILAADQGADANSSIISFNVDGSQRGRITGDGRLGINTDPGTLLELTGRSGEEAVVTFNREGVQGTPDGTIGRLIYENHTDSVASIDVLRGGANDEAYIRFATQNESGSFGERVRIHQSGSVGIGTTNPQNILDIHGSSHDKIIIGSTGTGNAVGLQIIHAKGNAAEQMWQIQTDASADGNLKIRNATKGTDTVFLDSDTDKVTFIADINVTGVATATSLFEGTTRVATTGKAIAMAMLFG